MLGMLKGPRHQLSQRANNWVNYQIRNFFSNYKADRAVTAHAKILRKLASQKKFQERAIKRYERYDRWSKKPTPTFISRITNYLKHQAQRDIDDSLKQIERLKKENVEAALKGLKAVSQSPEFAEFKKQSESLQKKAP